jgi:hypothetical protein
LDLSAALRQAADAAEQRAGLEQEITRLFALETPDSPRGVGLRGWVSDHVRLYGLARAAWAALLPRPSLAILSRDFVSASAALTPGQRRHALPVHDDGWRTILTPDYRLLGVDDRDPRIRLGFEISISALRQIHHRATAVQVPLLVVFVPTKESAFWPRGANDERVQRLVRNEARLLEELQSELRANRIDNIDVLPVLRRASAQPYFEDIDGHPNATGHRLIAEAVAAQIR